MQLSIKQYNGLRTNKIHLERLATVEGVKEPSVLTKFLFIAIAIKIYQKEREKFIMGYEIIQSSEADDSADFERNLQKIVT